MFESATQSDYNEGTVEGAIVWMAAHFLFSFRQLLTQVGTLVI